jgi:signal transduction histidine kinase/tetratricopeptide (TPR) repeat protein/ActR/RegA family two-component response regulator
MKKLLFIVMLLLPLGTYAKKQGKRPIDAALRKLPKLKEDTNKVNVLNELAANYASVNTNEGIKYGLQGLVLAEKLAWKKGIANMYNSLGTNYMSKADYPKALNYLSKAQKINEKLDNKSGIALNLRNIGMIHVTQGNYKKAKDYYLQALEINEMLEDKNGIAKDLGNIGSVYQNQSNYAVALDYFLRALKMNEELGDKAGIAGNLSSIGIVYISQGNYPGSLENYSKALKIYEDLGDRSGIARNLKNIGNVYLSTKEYTLALEYYNKSLLIHEALEDKSGIARNLGNMGNVYQEQNDHSKALKYLLKAYEMNNKLGEKYPMANNLGSIGLLYLTIARDTTGTIVADSLIPTKPLTNKIDKTANLHKAVSYLERATAIDMEIGNLNELQYFSIHLSEAQELLGNYKAALESYTKYTNAKDSVFSVENNLKIARLEEKREAELKQKQIEMQELKIAATKHQRRYYITGLSMLVLLSAGMFRRFRVARKTKRQLEEKNRIIEAERENAHQQQLRAERSEYYKQQFLTNMSHEIRTPMNAVNGMTDLLIDKDPRPDQLHYLQIIARSSDILLHIIDDILDLSKIEAGKLELESVDFSLADTLRQVKETLLFRAEEKGLQLTTAIDEGIPPVLLGDPFRLNQVLINLTGNAIKFTEKGIVKIEVASTSREAEQVSLLFSVTDTGIGIAEDKLDSLFESFNQAQSSDSRIYGGTGLGLSISRQLVELQGGKIAVSSKVGSGTTFSFELSYPSGSPQRLQQRTQKEKKADGTMLNGLRILLVDDNDYNRLVASETLHSKADVAIDEAQNGQEAIDMLRQNNYDIVLMDIQMPVMNGLEATRYIRSKLPPPKNTTPIVALTASLLHTDADRYAEAGMNSYLHKPFKTWQLIGVIAAVTGRK